MAEEPRQRVGARFPQVRHEQEPRDEKPRRPGKPDGECVEAEEEQRAGIAEEASASDQHRRQHGAVIDGRHEGGILALMALVGRHGTGRRSSGALLVVGLFGAALLYGDGVITPAISVLGAVEGVSVAAPALHHLVVPAAVAILLLLFNFQKRGTATVGAVFGPVMLVWFLVIAVLGVRGILLDPAVVSALNPVHAASFFARNGGHGFLVLGGVVLVITGGEALYADMGHFGKRPIRVAWLRVVMPALFLNYLGQGALLLHDPGAARNPFYLLAPAWAVYPLIAIATAAAIVASQALITGAYSLTRQAVQLGYCAAGHDRHTSSREIGPDLPSRGELAARRSGCIALVLGFRLLGTSPPPTASR